MKPGRRWIVFDADFYGNDFTDRLHARFGWAGVGVFVAFLCAAKRSAIPGRISFTSDAEARDLLRINGWPLVDDHGETWTLDDFWAFTGRMKQTQKTRRGRIQNVRATRWEQWQNVQKTLIERERKRRSRANSERDNVPLERESERERESDSPARAHASCSTASPEHVNSSQRKTETTNGNADLVGSDAIAQLRAERGWVDQPQNAAEVASEVAS